jgi:hypothetical protein
MATLSAGQESKISEPWATRPSAWSACQARSPRVSAHALQMRSSGASMACSRTMRSRELGGDSVTWLAFGFGPP